MGTKKQHTTDDFLLQAEAIIQQLRRDNRKLLEAEDERDAIWARIGIDKGTMELEIIAKQVRKRTNKEDV